MKRVGAVYGSVKEVMSMMKGWVGGGMSLSCDVAPAGREGRLIGTTPGRAAARRGAARGRRAVAASQAFEEGLGHPTPPGS